MEKVLRLKPEEHNYNEEHVRAKRTYWLSIP